MILNDKRTWELCGNCGQEVKIPVGRRSACPECGETILPCSMCYMDEVKCSKCPFEINYLHTAISKNYLAKEIKKLCKIEDSFTFKLDDQKYYTFHVSLDLNDDDVEIYKVKVYKFNQHWKPIITHTAFTKNGALKKLGITIPNHLKLHKNF